MRRSGHPSRPRAMTCCFFASLKTLLISTKATALRRNQRPRASSSLAGFEVTLIGRFWVTPEVRELRLPRLPAYPFLSQLQWGWSSALDGIPQQKAIAPITRRGNRDKPFVISDMSLEQ